MFRSLGIGRGNTSNPATTLIATGTTIDGDICFGGTLEIEGTVNGNVLAQGDEHAVVRILPGGHVCGNVEAPIVVVNGLVTGNVRSSEHVELASNAIVRGDVEYSLIEMTKGAQVEGRMHFSAPSSEAHGGVLLGREPSIGDS